MPRVPVSEPYNQLNWLRDRILVVEEIVQALVIKNGANPDDVSAWLSTVQSIESDNFEMLESAKKVATSIK